MFQVGVLYEVYHTRSRKSTLCEYRGMTRENALQCYNFVSQNGKDLALPIHQLNREFSVTPYNQN